MSRGVVSRRTLIVSAAGAALASGVGGKAGGQETPSAPPAGAGFEPPVHGLSAFGDLRYPPGFAHLDYASPDAPAGGTYSTVPSQILGNQNFNTFNTLNAYVLRGDGAAGMELCFASLMVRAQDEPDAVYGAAAASVEASPDRLGYRFRLRPEARFHDGSPITASDVAFSLATLKEKGHPSFSESLHDVAAADVEDDRTLTVRLAPTRSRGLVQLVAAMPIFSKAYYATRAFDRTTLEPPLGSGRYKVGRFEQGRYIEYERIPGHWTESVPAFAGLWHFDRIRYEFFRDRSVAFEGFKGRTYLFRGEYTARVWATGYDFPAVTDGRIKRETLPDDTPSGAQGWFINTRRAKFGDPRVREALICAFDFEWTNANLMFGAYRRTQSYFQNSDMMAHGLPGPEELKLLEPWRGKVPDDVFGEAYCPPVSDGSGQDRKLLRRAADLLAEAGFRKDGGRMLDASGQPFTVEFLDFEPSIEPHTGAYIKNLRVLGIEGGIRRVDPAQYQARLDQFDFDLTIRRFSMPATPDEGLRLYFGALSADIPGSNNMSGIRSEAVDALVKAALGANSRAELVTTCRALDRLVRAGRYWVPQWYRGTHLVAYWDIYRHPATEPPRYGFSPESTWWFDKDAAARIGVSG